MTGKVAQNVADDVSSVLFHLNNRKLYGITNLFLKQYLDNKLAESPRILLKNTFETYIILVTNATQ